MKNLFKRVLSIAAATALLMTSVISASAVEHDHKSGTCLNPEPANKTKHDGDYTITLTYPTVEGKDAYKFDDEKSHYGAYQIFSGTVKGETTDKALNMEDPTNSQLPITDIKWGNAFGKLGDPSAQTNILEFIYALSSASTGAYSYAFKDFNGFEKFFDGNNLNTDYTIDSEEISVTATALTKGDVTKVKFDKLAVEVAEVLTAHAGDHEWLQAFTDILGGYAGKTGGEEETESYHNKAYANQYYEGFVDGEGSKYTIYVPAGYYMVRDLSTIDDTAIADYSHAYSARMLFVTNNVDQVLKVDVPTLDKEILRGTTAIGETGNKTDVAGVGDVVHFQLKGTLPDNYDDYLGGYQYKFIDTLSKGLDLVQYNGDHADYVSDANACVNVTVKGLFKYADGKWTWDSSLTGVITIPVTSSTDRTDLSEDSTHLTTSNYTATYDSTTHKLEVSFPCLKEIRLVGTAADDGLEDKAVYRLGYSGDGSSEIYLDYYAKVNKEAVVKKVGVTDFKGNNNEAQIEYSDNPQAYADTDKTVINEAKVYTFGLDITKIDAAAFIKGDEVPLSEAQFAILRKDASNNYEYAIVAENGSGQYAITSWSKVSKTVTETDGKSLRTALSGLENISISTNASGKFEITGLDAGVEYTLVEIKTPSKMGDYAFIEPITFTINAEDAAGEYTGKIKDITTGKGFSTDKTVSVSQSVASYTNNEGFEEFTVVNFKYTDLPSTGGIGVYIYYIAGGCIVALAVVLFALSKKKKTTK